jgi:hypothetical protein
MILSMSSASTISSISTLPSTMILPSKIQRRKMWCRIIIRAIRRFREVAVMLMPTSRIAAILPHLHHNSATYRLLSTCLLLHHY